MKVVTVDDSENFGVYIYIRIYEPRGWGDE